MADQKVSDLPSLNGADVDAADLLYIVDSSAGAAGSKKITIGQYQLAPVSGGTANTVVYLNGSKVESSSSALTFDGTNFATTGTSSAAKLIPTGGTATGNGMYLPAANTLAWSNNGAETMRLDASGNLGLGVTPSAWASGWKALQLANGSSFVNNGATNYTGIFQNAYYNGTNTLYLSSTYALKYELVNGTHAWYTAPSGTAGNAISFTQAMTLDANGKLDVPQNFISSSGWQSNGTTYTTAAAIYNGVYGLNSDIIAIATGGSERARITSGGDLLVGTTSTIGVGARTNIYSASGNALHVQSGSAAANNIVSYNSSGTASFNVANNGNVTNTNNSYGAISDAKLKENISDATPKLDNLMQVRVVNYNLKTQPDQKHIGVIAQELEQVFPGMVEESTDYDAEGNDLGTTTKAVKYSVFVPMLIKALQEQQALIEDLRARVAALEAK